MGAGNLFDVKKQLSFYGSYHATPVNILIHMTFVPILVWTFEVMLACLNPPSWLPHVHHVFNEYIVFDLNWAAVYAAVNWLYYFALDPIAAIIYIPQMMLSLLTANALPKSRFNIISIFVLHYFSWGIQFIGHGVFEKRAPALLDNILGAAVLAPFFVHLEILFKFGYRPQLHKEIKNEVGREVAQFRRERAAKEREAKAKSQ